MKRISASAYQRAAALFILTGGIGGLLGVSGVSAFAQTKPTVPAPTKDALPDVVSAPAPPAIKADSGLLAAAYDRPIRGMGWPALSPDGRMLCFTYLGDLWTVPTSGGAAARLTIHEALDAYPRWSPDGKFIAFTSLRTGNADVFIVPSSGGAARQVTFNSANDWVNDWSPDGKKLLFYSMRDTKAFAMYSIDLRTRAVKRLTNDEEPLRFGAWSPDGKTIAYSRSGQPWWRPWYRGSVASHIVVEDLATSKVHTLFKANTQQFWPLYSPDSKSLYVTTVLGGVNTPNLYRVPVEGGEPKQITKYTTDAVRYPTIARNGSLLAYVYNGGIWTTKPDGTDTHEVDIVASSDDKTNNQERMTLKDSATQSELSPDGKQLALVLRGDIWLVPSSGGDTKQLTDDPSNDDDLSWSPDGTKLAFVSDRGNQPNVYTIDVKTKALTKLTNDGDAKSTIEWSPDGKYVSFAKAGSQSGLYLIPGGGGTARQLAAGNGNNNYGIGLTGYAWSPDSRWVGFERMDRYQTRDIWVIPTVGGVETNVTRYPGNNVSCTFTKDGKNLLFISDRNNGLQLFRLPLETEDDAQPADDAAAKKQPKVDRSKDVKIDFTDISQRAQQINLPVPFVTDYAPTPDSQRVVVQDAGNFWIAGIKGGGVQPLTAGETGSNIEFTPDGQRFFYLGANGTPRSLGVGFGPPQSPSVVAFSADLVFDRRAQYRQAFNEFYRRFGAAFYDAKLHGVNWSALRDKYEPLLQGVGTPEEFANLLSEMVGEVNSSHSEIGAASRVSGPKTATLGIFYDDSYTGPGLKVANVMPKGPADHASTRLNPGDYVLSVNGTDVAMTEEYYETLQDKAGKTVDLLVNSKPTKDGARTIKVKAIDLAEWMGLEYEARVRQRRAEVEKLSGGRLAYIHIPLMDQPSLKKFERELYSDGLNKEGLILDIRGNGGGNTHDQILQALSKHVYGYVQPRDGVRQTQPLRAFTKPIVLLIDQDSFSDAEIFPAGFRALKLGKIVGVPTPGYVIGTYDSQLIDGTHIRLPSWGNYTLDGKNLENLGIPPDITVENRPEDVAAGKDRQLETAVATALKELPARADTTASVTENVGVSSSANSNPNGGSSAVRPGSKGSQSRTP